MTVFQTTYSNIYIIFITGEIKKDKDEKDCYVYDFTLGFGRVSVNRHNIGWVQDRGGIIQVHLVKNTNELTDEDKSDIFISLFENQ